MVGPNIEQIEVKHPRFLYVVTIRRMFNPFVWGVCGRQDRKTEFQSVVLFKKKCRQKEADSFLCTARFSNLHFCMVERLHIGKMIRERLEADGRTVVWFAAQIHCSRVNAYKIFSKESIDVELLCRICSVLNHDFFLDISSFLKNSQTVSK